MSPFPDEILTNILFRLPVKGLLRSRSVSKSWLALIDSSYFVKLHLKRSIQTRTNLALFFIPHPDRELFKVALDSIEEDCVVQLVEDDSIEESLLRDSCHGLLCITNGTSKAALWNPSTRKYLELPYTPLIEIDDTIEDDIDDLDLHFSFRICYDNINDDYKVVRLSVLDQNDRRDVVDSEIKIYSLNSNSWHKLENCLHYPNFDGTEDPIAIAEGALHWISDGISDSGKVSSIVAFNLGTDTYRVIQKPGGLNQLRYLHLHNLGETLSLSCQYESMSVDIFLLKEYGENNEYWSKLVTISPTMSFAPLYCVRPISYSKSGKKVLLEVDNEKLIWYDLEHESFEEIRVHGMTRFFTVFPCVESLVSVDVAAAVDVAGAVVASS